VPILERVRRNAVLIGLLVGVFIGIAAAIFGLA